MKELTTEKLQELMNDPEFQGKMSAVTYAEDIVELLAQYDIRMSVEEVEAGYQQAIAELQKRGLLENGEMSGQELDMVAGGVRSGVCAAGLTAGYSGLLMMMCGAAGGPALWLGGCAVAACGLAMKSKKKKRK